jgi:hypothetical protein
MVLLSTKLEDAPMQRLQIELLGGLGRDELHGWTLHRLSDGLQ